MAITRRNKLDIANLGTDYLRIRNFLIDLNDENFLFGRWDWMVTHTYLDETGLPAIAVWEEDSVIAALATYDTELGHSYFCVKPGFEHLKQEMLEYLKEHFRSGNSYRALISNRDTAFQNIAAAAGFRPTTDGENDAYFPIDIESTSYILPEGFSISSMADNYDMFQYGRVLWKGFDHEANGEGEYRHSDNQRRKLEREMKRPNVNLSLKIAVANSAGDFVSYCGMWQDENSEYALVEPVATDPEYRGLDLGKAAVLEGIKRCGMLGAKTAWVGSDQLFYYRIGFRPFRTSTWWKTVIT